jgi:integrase
MEQAVKLTKSVVDRIPLVQSGQAYFWDTEFPGFGVRIGTTSKSYFVERRVNGRTVRKTIGKHGIWTAEQARNRARELRVQMDRGVDLIARAREERAQARARGVTLGEVFEEYLKTRQLKPVTAADYQRAMREALEDWRNRAITEITRTMVKERHEKLGKTSKARANLAMRLLRALYNFASAQYEDGKGEPIVRDNPVKRLSQQRAWFKINRRQTWIKPYELKAWYDAVISLRGADEPGSDRDAQGRFTQGAVSFGSKANVVSDYVLFLLFTGMRREEAARLVWDDVDLRARIVTVRDTKNGEDHTLPLSDFLVELLTRRKAEATSGHVFPGEGKTGHIVEPRRQMEKVTAVSGVAFTLHDLRRTFITIAESLDIPAYALKRLLNHKMRNDVTAGYIVTDVERLRKPMQQIADFILKAAGLRQSAEVVDFQRASA